MVDAIILGSIGLDDVRTPFGEVKGALGGSASYASLACSFFVKPGVVSIVGDDFPKEYEDLFASRGISLEGVERKEKTFRWSGAYEHDMNEAKTLRTELNSLQAFSPLLPKEYQEAKYVFLANTDPDIQLSVLEQVRNPKLVILDTMNFWIESKKDRLLEAIRRSDILLLNDGEARQLFGTVNLMKAAKEALKIGPKHVIIKKGEHGALYFTDTEHFNAPGYPLEFLKDPTGCGDSFGGGLLGYLAKTGDASESNVRRAIIYGSVIASHNAEDFSLNRVRAISLEDVEKRFAAFGKMREF
ncbi:MAG TPA: PfkB family carbohydrate kinase [Candidatus Nanoarchaeia archaeon]|nr:PfkB family carbohydrate kinase [Candidatus Nanoarchaeia archaeon]